jgi:hypothetical protein
VLPKNKCSKGFYIFLGKSGLFNIEVTFNGNMLCFDVKSECGLIKVDLVIAEYISSGIIDIRVKQNNKYIEIPYGGSCEKQCGITLQLSNRCSVHYPLLNEGCAITNVKYTFKTNNCKFNFITKNCKWIADMATSLSVGNIALGLTNDPISNVAGVATINPFFVAELANISPNFSVALVAGDAVVSYIGTDNIEFFDECKQITKTCI